MSNIQETPPFGFDQEAFRQGLGMHIQACNDQRARSGNFQIYGSRFEIPKNESGSSADSDGVANKPEEEAYRALVEYAAEQMLIARKQGQIDAAFEALDEIAQIHLLEGRDKHKLLRDILRAVFRLQEQE